MPALLLPGILMLAACSESAPTQPAPTTGTVAVSLRQSDQIATAVTGMLLDAAAGVDEANRLDPDTIASLMVRITGIQFLSADSTDADTSGWIALTLDTAVVVDLTALPTEGDSPLVIAAGSVPVGSYRNVRLLVDSAVVRFTGPITLGNGMGQGHANGGTFDGDTDYPVTIPSAAQSGIKTDATFEVTGDDGNALEVGLLFSPDATFQNVHVTGNGRVMMAPVIRTRPGGSS